VSKIYRLNKKAFSDNSACFFKKKKMLELYDSFVVPLTPKTLG
jgi:hypothetical protein